MARHNMVIGLVFTKKHKDEFRMTHGPVTSPGCSLDIDGYTCLNMTSGQVLNFDLLDVEFDEAVFP